MKEELAKELVRSLKEAGINFVTFLPETRLSQIIPLLRDDPDIDLIPVASEAEGVTIAAGATLGGKQAACYCENTGLFVACYSLVVIAEQIGVPVLMIVGFLGGQADQRNSSLYATIGRRTLPFLTGLGIEHAVLKDGEKLETEVKDAVRTMNALRSPVALLFTGDFTL